MRKVDAFLADVDGNVLLDVKNISVPSVGIWSTNAVTISADKYFIKQNKEGAKSISFMCGRVVDAIFENIKKVPKSLNSEDGIRMVLMDMLLRQEVSFNSPVWFNFVPGSKKKTGSACFILDIEDDLISILKSDYTEAIIYADGSGAGINYSRLRRRGAPLSGGGQASGPLSFMFKSDATGHIIKSGGLLRRAAKMNILNIDHPDIPEYISSKRLEEYKAKALMEWDSANGNKYGWSKGGYECEAYKTVAHQNANHSVGIFDRFMEAVIEDDDWEMTSRISGRVVRVIRARELFTQIASNAHECADPGLFFIDEVNRKNPFYVLGLLIHASNPCLSGDTLIGTDTGIACVSDLDGQTIKILHNDGFVTANVFKTGIKEVIRVHVSGGHYIDTTHDHRWRTSDGEWVEAQDLIGKKIMFRKHDEINPMKEMPIAVIAGFLLGDGVFHHTNTCDTVDVKFSLKDGEVQEYIEYHLAIKTKKETSSVELLAVFRSYNIDECINRDRDFPLGLSVSTYQHAMSFLKGLYTANGSVVRDRVTLKSVNRKIIDTTQKVLSILGIKSYITTNKSHNNKFSNGTYVMRESYDLNISGDGVVDFYNKIGFVQSYKMEKLKKIVDGREFIESTNRPMIVKTIEYLGEEDVFDFSIINKTNERSGLICGFELHNCGEFVFFNNSACNLASLRLTAFINKGGKFGFVKFRHAVRVLIYSMDTIVSESSYPTKEIEDNSKHYRPLGLGYSDLGGLLMEMGIPYDSNEGRKIASDITRVMTEEAWITSAELAKEFGHNLTDEEQDALTKFVKAMGFDVEGPFRNSQVSLLAPTGTTSFEMDCSTTGIEPLTFLSMLKKMVGGSSFTWIPRSVGVALENLGYSKEDGIKHIENNESLVGFVTSEQESIFHTAEEISPQGHIDMMVAVQPYLTGAISKTVNLPEETTVEEIEEIYMKAWQNGLKGITIYRKGSKSFAPLQSSFDSEDLVDNTDVPKRKRLPEERPSLTHKFEVGGHEGYVTVGFYPDTGKVGELFIAMAKEGSTLSGFMDSVAQAVSISLQYNIPLDVFIDKFEFTNFEPSGITSSELIPMASSLLDYIFRWLKDVQSRGLVFDGSKSEVKKQVLVSGEKSGRICPKCSSMMVRQGTCHYCNNCNTSDGCS